MTGRSAGQKARGDSVASAADVPRKAATACRSSRWSGYATDIITPKSSVRRIRVAGSLRSASRLGIRGLV